MRKQNNQGLISAVKHIVLRHEKIIEHHFEIKRGSEGKGSCSELKNPGGGSPAFSCSLHQIGGVNKS